MELNDTKQTFDYLRQHESCLSENQVNFLKSLRKYYKWHGQLSARQEKILFDLKKFLNIEALSGTPVERQVPE